MIDSVIHSFIQFYDRTVIMDLKQERMSPGGGEEILFMMAWMDG